MNIRLSGIRRNVSPHTLKSRFLSGILALGLLATAFNSPANPAASANDYAAVNDIFREHCFDCHGVQDPEGSFVLETFDGLMKGGEIGAALVPGKSSESLLVKMIEGRFEKDGKTKLMPPGKRKKLEPAEIATIKAWIDAGAHGPASDVVAVKELVVPKIALKVPPRKPVMALAYASKAKLLAIGTFGEVELRTSQSDTPARRLTGHHGNVNTLIFSSDESQLFALSGEPGVYGEVHQWKIADGSLMQTFQGHKDTIYAGALSPDGKTLATGSYDQKIKLWDTATGRELKILSGHNGAVFSLAFRPDGKILASASADRTVKLWDVATGERRDTLSQPTREVYAVAFTPDGKRLMAGGVDNRIRIWSISETAAETTNPLLDSKFAHEGSILNLVFSTDGQTLATSAEDKTVKLWNADKVTERTLVELQPDWSRALIFIDGNKTVVAGRMDGTLGCYDAHTGKTVSSLTARLSPANATSTQAGVAKRAQ